MKMPVHTTSNAGRNSTAAGRFLLRIFFLLICLTTVHQNTSAQSGGFELTTSPNVDFTFNTFEKYENGIIKLHALELNVNAVGAQWDLYMGATTSVAGSMNVVSTYSTVGISPPPVNLLKARVYNQSNTQQTGGGFFDLTDVALPVYLIGSPLNDIGVSCGDAVPTGTNEAGDYLTSPSCYKFNVDLKLDPGFTYRPGLYTMRVDFYIIEDL
ncbi:hypothetical protein BH11BAC1_BH11BAC1_04200 [soil metagenome]